MALSSDTIDKFKRRHEEAWKDTEWASVTHQHMERRESVSRELLAFLDDFIAAKITLTEFKTTFDKRTKKEWDSFGLKGMSGAMFLNMMTLHAPDGTDLTSRLRQTLHVPQDEAEGRERMAGFFAYLNDTLAQHRIPARKLQPRRTPFFLSAWWHMQDRKSWPIFYESARQVLASERILEESGDPVDDYFRFRSVWLRLRDALDISPWDLELLCSRLSKAAVVVVKPDPVQPGAESAGEIDEPPTDSMHVEVQSLLAELGLKLGCKVWIAANDHSKQWKGQRLKSLSIPALPYLNMGEDAQRIINLIDVIWLKGGKQVVAAFEVESTTSIYSGLLRMADLITTCPNLNILCFIAVPQNREALVRKQLSRPTFQSLDLNSRCGFFSIESLKEQYPAMMKWAKDPSSIKELATFVADTSE